MPTANALSNSKSSRKGKGCTRSPLAPKKKQGGCKKGALKWVNAEYLQLFHMISEERPTGNNQWEVVSTRHSEEGPTKRSVESCKLHWFPVLKIKKLTGGTRMHPLHCLALAIDADINKASGTYVMNDNDVRNPYGELEVEFQHAEDNMRCYKLDLNRAPNFNLPMPDENAEVDEDNVPDELSAEDTNNGSEDGGEGNKGALADGGEVAGDDASAMEGVWPLSQGSTVLDDPEHLLDPPVLPEPKTPAQSSAKTQTNCVDCQQALGSSSKPQDVPAPFPMSKAVNAKPNTPMLPKKLVNSVDLPARKRPEPKPKRQATPEQRVATKTPSKSKAHSTPSFEIIDEPVPVPVQSNKRKASDEVKQEAGKGFSSKKSTMSSLKAPQVKPKEEDEEVIEILDEDDAFVNNFIAKKSEGNMASIAFMDQKRKIQRLESKLEDANAKIQDLQMNIISLKQELTLQQHVDAELARCKQQQQLAVPPAAPAPAPHHLNHPFDPNHPFNHPPPGDDLIFGAPHIH